MRTKDCVNSKKRKGARRKHGEKQNSSYFLALIASLGFLLFETMSYCVAQADLKLVILLPQPRERWDYRQVCTTTSGSLHLFGEKPDNF
jgi:hypothetical protein